MKPSILASPARRTTAGRIGWAALLLTGVMIAPGCSDVGDSSAFPPGPGGPDATGADVTLSSDSASDDGAASDDTGTAAEAATGDDGPTPPTGDDGPGAVVVDAMSDGEGPQETGADAGPEAGADAAADVQETSTVVEAGPDATLSDAGPDAQETGAPETGAPEAGGTEAGAEAGTDGGGREAGGPDGGDAGHGLVPCTTAGQTGCVQCEANTSLLCTPTEALFVQHDIDKGLAAAPGPDPSGSCYFCLYQADCINNDTFGDTAKECEDPIQTFGTSVECRDTIQCILGSNCAESAVAPCYCGTLGLATTCQGTSGVPVNGACDTVIAAGLGFAVGDGTDNTAKLENSAYAAGRANQIFQCGVVANGCVQCQQ
jgi:hypothetical protein